MIPSLSVVHTAAVAAQERRPGALLAAEAQRAVERPGTNHLNPTGVSTSVRPRSAATRSIIDELTAVLPIPARGGQSGRFA